jgi:hypothetical protein
MLHQFLTSNRDELITRCREKVAKRFAPAGIPPGADLGVPLFLRQLSDILRREQMTPAELEFEPTTTQTRSEYGRAAAMHGSEMLRQGFAIGHVVHGYGDVCQSVTELAVELRALISADEFRTLNRCLDDAIADAVTAFGADRQDVVDHGAETLQNRLDHLLAEQLRLIDIAIQSFSAIRTGTIGLAGATGTLLAYTLDELRTLPVRILAGNPQPTEQAAAEP